MLKKVLMIFVVMSSVVLVFAGNAFADETDIQVLLDGKNITDIANPIIRNNRTLVPIRAISESLDAKVTWFNESRRVVIKKDDEKILLKIDSHLLYLTKDDQYLVSDIPPIIYKDSTYVPLRLISQSLNVDIQWNGENRQVIMSSGPDKAIDFSKKINITNIENNDSLMGTKDLKIELHDITPEEIAEVRLMILDPITWKGFIKEITPSIKETISFKPSFNDEGIQLLALAAYDSSGHLIAGDLRRINIEVLPTIKIQNLQAGDVIKDDFAFKTAINFIPKSISYEITNLSTMEKTQYTDQDPFGIFNWDPQDFKNGDYEISAWITHNEKTYQSKKISFKLDKEKKISLLGVSPGEVIDSDTRLIAKRNFDVMRTFYYMRDLETDEKQLLKEVPYGSFLWSPKAEDVGEKALSVGVYDVSNRYFESSPIYVEVDFSPRLSLSGLYPNSTITESKSLTINSNVDLMNEELILKTNNNEMVLNKEASDAYTIDISKYSSGDYEVYARGTYNDNNLESAVIPFSIYKGETYGPKPLTEKSEFLPLVSKLALNSYKKTNMSASLQTAQAILESGWGQSVPVDKYTGQFSYNLFGIKGRGTNGSIISNTWEVYNGQVYRIDDAFRAYHSVNESWDDHKALLLNASRYSIFRDVMYDHIQGAWAIKRAGYATDPQYPIKLMRIIDEYDLRSLDAIQF